MSELELIAKFSADTGGLEKGVNKAAKSVNKYEAAIQKVTGVSAESAKAIKQFALVAGATAIAVGVKSVKAFAKFEKGMAEVGTLTKFTSKQMRGMSQETLKLTAKFGQTVDVMTKARYDIVSAGFKSITEQTEFLTQANQLAIAGVTDVATATDALTSVVGAYGKEVISAERASDILFATVRAGKTTIGELAPAIGKVLPTAKAAGVSFEEVGAAIATMTAAGINTPQAVTALNSAIFALAAPTKEAKAAMEEMGTTLDKSKAALEGMGIQTTDAAGAMLPLVDVIGQFEGLSLEEIRKVIPDKEASKAILAAANNMDIFRENTESMIKVAGVTREAYVKMAETTAQKLAVLNSSFSVLKTTFGAFITDNRSGIDVLGFTTGVLNDWTRLMTLNSDGVSVLRREWQMFASEFTLGSKSIANINRATNENLANQNKRLAETITKLNTEQLEFFVKNRLEAGEAVFSKDKETAKRIAEINRKLAGENIETFKQSAEEIGASLTGIIDIFQDQMTSEAPKMAAPLSENFTKEGQRVASGFAKVIQGMRDNAAIRVAVSAPVGAAERVVSNFINKARSIVVSIFTKTVATKAEGGFVYGFAGGGIAPSDTVPAMLTPGEFVVKKSSVQGNEAALSKLNTTGGFARGGLIRGFQGGGAVAGGGGAGALEALEFGIGEDGGVGAGGILSEFRQQLLIEQEEMNAELASKQREANSQFIDLMTEFEDGMREIQLSKMDEREQLIAEKQAILSEILQFPFSEEQREIALENAALFYDAQIEALEDAAIADREKEELDKRLKNLKRFASLSQSAFGTFFDGVISGEKNFEQALGSAFKRTGQQLIDLVTSELLVRQIGEIGKATILAPGTFGASLLWIPAIAAAGAAAKAGLGAIKFHEGGIVGGDINAPPQDVPAILQTGEAVVSRDTVQDIAAGGTGRPMEITINLELDGDDFAQAVVNVPANAGVA